MAPAAMHQVVRDAEAPAGHAAAPAVANAQSNSRDCSEACSRRTCPAADAEHPLTLTQRVLQESRASAKHGQNSGLLMKHA